MICGVMPLLYPFMWWQYDLAHVNGLSKKLVDGLTSQLDHVIRNGDAEQTYEGTVLFRAVTV